VRAVSAFGLALLIAGCFTPNLGDGAVACGVNGLCPARYFCHSDNRCYKTPDTSGGDMAETFDFAAGDFAGCMKATCGPQSCGIIPDNCGSTIDCGNMCTIGKSCGGGGTPHECGCATQISCGSRNCGTALDGCGGVQSCGGACTGGQSCGAKMPNVCGGGATCMPKACAGGNCGLISDGCSAVLDCGMCSGGKTCSSTDHMCH
jgi:hypothetical protein